MMSILLGTVSVEMLQVLKAQAWRNVSILLTVLNVCVVKIDGSTFWSPLAGLGILTVRRKDFLRTACVAAAIRGCRGRRRATQGILVLISWSQGRRPLYVIVTESLGLVFGFLGGLFPLVLAALTAAK